MAMVIVALIMARVLIELTPQAELPIQFSFIYTGGVDGARGLLSAVASATLGVAATLFSITLAALSSVISSMGPRLLLEFIKDRFIQTTLGIFLATFVFSLFSLRSVSAGEGFSETEFIPYLNVTVAIGLAIICVCFLIYYIVHMAQTISLSHVVNLLARDMSGKIEELSKRGDSTEERSAAPEEFWINAQEQVAKDSGYVTVVDHDALEKLAVKEDIAIRVLVKPGDMVLAGEPVIQGVPSLPDSVLNNVVLGKMRDESEDALFAIRQLTEIGVRGLSSGTNDPYTVVDVVDHFIQVLVKLGDSPLPSGVRYEGDRFRMSYATVSYEDLLVAMFTQIRRDTKDATVVYLHLLDGIGRLGRLIQRPERKEALLQLAHSCYKEAQREIESQVDLHDVRQLHDRAIKALA